MFMRKPLAALFLGAFIASLATQLPAAVIPPVGLAPGSQYQVIFVTGTTTNANSADIGYYNNIVQTEAGVAAAFFGLPGGLTWHAVASTPTTDARDNAPSLGLPVYNTHGQLVSPSNIYAGSLQMPVFYNAIGNPYTVANAAVWTGSDPFGVGLAGLTLGGPGPTGEVGLAGVAGGFGWTTILLCILATPSRSTR